MSATHCIVLHLTAPVCCLVEIVGDLATAIWSTYVLWEIQRIDHQVAERDTFVLLRMKPFISRDLAWPLLLTPILVSYVVKRPAQVPQLDMWISKAQDIPFSTSGQIAKKQSLRPPQKRKHFCENILSPEQIVIYLFIYLSICLFVCLLMYLLIYLIQ